VAVPLTVTEPLPPENPFVLLSVAVPPKPPVDGAAPAPVMPALPPMAVAEIWTGSEVELDP
jgi:hypothetical protein